MARPPAARVQQTPGGASGSPPRLPAPAPAGPKALQRYLALDDFEKAARGFLPRVLHAFVEAPAESGAGGRNARAAYDALALVPRVLVDVSGRDLSRTVMGQTYRLPFGIAPMGMSGLVAYRGEMALARAAAAAGAPMILSGMSTTPLEEVRRAGPTSWFQAYLPGQPALIDPLIDRVAAAGYEVLVLTVDIPVSANLEKSRRAGYAMPLRPSLRLALDGLNHPAWALGVLGRTFLRHGSPHLENLGAGRDAAVVSRRVVGAIGGREQLDWTHVAHVRRRWRGKLVLKGILSAADALLAREHGVDGIVISNHGGRQLDHAVAPLSVLPAIRAAAPGLGILIDGGIRRGTDVIKALALGADFVLLGRPFLYAAAVAGEAGVGRAFQILRKELDTDMALLGVRRLDELGVAHLAPRP